ncbi:ABC transporter permease subunit [Klugiella xanthotipulae]|uniref:ABC-2 type transport system permease protein n=1 Tax=Klugiella xanthotipulae TaxID=244735 RepID=A0A543HTH6_9MICO|nr:ABC transporter permease subunit [Klugiella xanthotipulae]TQM61574.1 ABC-2 type transport system permease protein [Klugiella xanthotipulae]
MSTTTPASTVLPLLRHAMRESWRSLIGWSIGLVAALSLYLPLFPSIGGDSGIQDLIGNLPPELTAALSYQNIFTGAGYTQSTFFGLMGFVLLSIAGISWGTAAIAGDEERGTLELTLAHGVSRTQVVLERSAAIVLRVAVLGLVTALTILLLNGPGKLELDAGNVFITVLAACGTTLLAAVMAIAVGSITGRRSYALLGGAAVAVLGYAFNALGNQTKDLEWLKNFSPYAWAFRDEPLVNGWSFGIAALYLGVVVLVGVALAAFNRRDVGR